MVLTRTIEAMACSHASSATYLPTTLAAGLDTGLLRPYVIATQVV